MTLYYIFAIALRLFGFNASAIWYDEAISRYRAAMPLSRLVSDLTEVQGLNAWDFISRLFPHDPLWLLRLPSLLCSIGTVWLGVQIIRKLIYNQSEQMTALIPLACLPGLLWMAQDARCYAGMAFFYLLALWAVLERRRWILTVACILLIGTHPTGAALAGSAILIAILERFPIRRLWPVLLVIPVMLIKYGYIASIDPGSGFVFWLSNTDGGYIWFQTMMAIWGQSISGWWVLPAMGLLSIILVIGGIRICDHKSRVPYLAVVIPITVMLLEGLLYKPVLFYRTIQPVIPAICLLAGAVIAPSRRWFSWILPATACLVLAVGMSNYDPSSRGGDLDDAAKFIEYAWEDGDVIYYATGTVAMPFDYYLSDKPSFILDGPADWGITPPGLPFDQTPLNSLDYTRAWMIIPREPLLSQDQIDLLDEYTQVATLIRRVVYMQAAPIEIYLLKLP